MVGYSLVSIVLSKFPSRENCSHDSDDAFAAFVHGQSLAGFVFYSPNSRRPSRGSMNS
jgi:hypothetical protein